MRDWEDYVRSRLSLGELAGARERRIVRELAAHLEDFYHDARARGLEDADADAHARRQIADWTRLADIIRAVDRPHVRSRADLRAERAADRADRQSGRSFMIASSMRLALRRLVREPKFTVAAALTLGLAIGVTTAVFAAAYAVLFRPLPMANADRLVVVWNSYRGELTKAAVAAPELRDLADRLTTVDEIAGIRGASVNLTGQGEPRRLNAILVSPNLARLLGVAPIIGSDFDRAAVAAGERLVLLSHATWSSLFGADPSIAGRVILIQDQPHTVLGVLPPDLRFPDAPTFHMPQQAEVWIGRAWREVDDERGNQVLAVFARRAAGASFDAVQLDLDRVGETFRREHPDRYSPQTGWRLRATRFREEVSGTARPSLVLLSGAAALILFIACANVSNLVLSRGAARRREVAVRTALGASRRQLAADALIESGMLSALGSVCGLAVATAGLGLLLSLAPDSVPHLAESRIDPVAVGFAAVLALVVTALTALGPMLAAGSGDLQTSLKGEGASGAAPGGWRRIQDGLAVGQMALAFAVVVAAVLLLRSVDRLAAIDLGFAPERTVATTVALPQDRYAEPEARGIFYASLLERLAASPGVDAVALADPIPLSGQAWSGTFHVAGRPERPGEPSPHAEMNRVSHGYFEALQIPIVEGRAFTPHDASSGPDVTIVDEVLARTFWPHDSAIGKRISWTSPDGPWREVVGVARHIRRSGPRHAGEPQLYMPYFQSRTLTMALIVRTGIDPAGVAPAVRQVVRALDPRLPVGEIVLVEDLAARVTATDRFTWILVSVFSLCALALAGLGLYAVVAFAVARRTREIGIRIALGSSRGRIGGLVVQEGGRLAVAGIALGVLVSWAAGTALESVLFDVSAHDPSGYAAAAALIVALTIVSAYFPARRAAFMDPVAALKG